jgi:hypothetical protein
MDEKLRNKIDQYIDFLAQNASPPKDEDIPNTTFEHAYQGVSFLIDNAMKYDGEDNEIKIISNQFYEDFWIRLIDEFKKYLEKNGKLSIILLKYINNNAVLQRLSMLYPDKIDIYFANKIDKSKLELIPNFTLIKPYGYRIELSDKEMENKIVTAYINFGNLEKSENLSKFFTLLMSKSEKKKF